MMKDAQEAIFRKETFFYIFEQKTMKKFLINHPEFLENALNADEKTKKRAKILMDGNLYGLN